MFEVSKDGRKCSLKAKRLVINKKSIFEGREGILEKIS